MANHADLCLKSTFGADNLHPSEIIFSCVDIIVNRESKER